MRIEFIVFLIAIILLIAYRTLGSGVISGAGGNIASGIKGTLAWIGEAGRSAGSAVGSRVIMGLLWIAVIVSMEALFPDAFASWWSHQNIFWVSQIVATLAILFLPIWATRTAMAGAIAVMLWSALDSTFWPEKGEKPKEVAQVDRDDTGWVQDPKEPLSEVRQMVVYPDQPKVAIISDQYRFDAKCKGEAKIKIYGRKKPIPCNPQPGTDHLGDSLRSVSGFYTLEFVTKTPVQVIIRRLPK